MSYIPTEWKTGDVVTAEKLNKLESGVAGSGGGALVVNVSFDEATSTYTADKTAGEILSAYRSGPVVFSEAVESTEQIYSLVMTYHEEGLYEFAISGIDASYTASSSSDYPTLTIGH